MALRERMQFADVRLDRGRAELRDDSDGRAHLVKPEAPTRENLLVAACVQIGEAFGELDLIAIEQNRAIGRFLLGDLFRQVVAVDRDKPPDARAAAFELASGALGFAQLYDVALWRT